MPGSQTDLLIRLKKWKRVMRFGILNVRSLYRSGSVNDSCQGISDV